MDSLVIIITEHCSSGDKMFQTPVLVLVFLISAYPSSTVFSLGSKFSSVDTILHVHRCPATRDEWMAASFRKNCSAISNPNDTKLEYHCVINEWANETIEVCAVNRMILFGKCSEYNHGAKRIQSSGMKSCSNFSTPCPTVYNSLDAYMYQGCYNLSKTTHGHSETTKTPTPAPLSDQATGLKTGIILGLIVLAAVAFVIGFAVIKQLYRKKPYNNSDESMQHLNGNKHSSTNEERFSIGSIT